MMPPRIRFLPPEIAALTFICRSCANAVPIPFKETYPEAFATVIPRDFDENTNRKYWRIVAKDVPCPNCGANTSLDFPIVTKRGNVLLFGDDSSRTEPEGQVFTFSMVGGSRELINTLQAVFDSFKLSLEPKRKPSSWAFHMKELHSGQHRAKHPVYHSWDEAKVDTAVNRLYEILDHFGRDIFTFNASFFRRSCSDLKSLKCDTYIALLMDLINGFTSKGVVPIFHFDSEKEMKGLGTVVHGWAREAFGTGQRQLAYAFLCRGLVIPEPLFIKPASHICSELADFVCFVVAREFRQRMKNLPIDYNSERLGSVFYSWLDSKDRYVQHRRIGLPFEAMITQ